MVEKKSPRERIETLEDIKMRGLFLHGYAITTDSTPIVFDVEEYRALVDQFYSENGDLLTPVQYRAMKESYEFFMTLVEQLIKRFTEETES